jgi:hypothetical protein
MNFSAALLRSTWKSAPVTTPKSAISRRAKFRRCARPATLIPIYLPGVSFWAQLRSSLLHILRQSTPPAKPGVGSFSPDQKISGGFGCPRPHVLHSEISKNLPTCHFKPPNLAQSCTILPNEFVFRAIGTLSRRNSPRRTPRHHSPDPTTSFLIGVHRRSLAAGTIFSHLLTPRRSFTPRMGSF